MMEEDVPRVLECAVVEMTRKAADQWIHRLPFFLLFLSGICPYLLCCNVLRPLMIDGAHDVALSFGLFFEECFEALIE